MDLMERTQILVLLECRRNMESSLHFSESHSSCLQKKDAATHFAGLSSVQFSFSVLSDSLRPHGLQHTRLPCPSPTPRVFKLMTPELVMPSNHLILCLPLLLLPSVFPSTRIFPNETPFDLPRKTLCHHPILLLTKARNINPTPPRQKSRAWL